MVWRSHLNEVETEELDEVSGFKNTRTTAPAAQAAQPASARNGGNSARNKSSTSKLGKGESAAKLAQNNADQQLLAQNAGRASGSGVTGSGEELALTLEKIVSQLDIVSRTLHVLEQRVSMNEESVSTCLEYFKEQRESRQNTNYVQN